MLLRFPGNRQIGEFTLGSYVEGDVVWEQEIPAIGHQSLPAHRLIRVQVNSAGAQDLSWLRELQCTPIWELDFSQASATRIDLEAILSMQDLRVLNLRGIQLTQQNAEVVSRLPTLEELDLSMTGFRDEWFALLSRLPSLQVLRLSDNRASLNGEGLSRLSDLSNLHTLDLAETSFSDTWAKELLSLQALECLFMSGSRVTDVGLLPVGLCKRLRVLTLDTQSLVTTVAPLRELGRLEELSLRRTGLTDGGSSCFPNLTAVQTLACSRTEITDSAVQSIARMKELWSLSLDNTSISDRGVEYLGQLKKLRLLKVRGSNLTPTGLRRLTELLPQCRTLA